MVSRIDMSPQDMAMGHIRQAARATGADFDFLVSTAARESNFDSQAQARTSSATGMFQFIEQTWLGTMQQHGDKHGYGQFAQAISQDERGRFQVEDGTLRQQILDLRFDPSAAARMAGELAADNAAVIQSRLGRDPSSGELYAAHFLGADGAAALIATAERAPETRAAELFPAAARANRSIFYAQGQPRSAADVLARLTGEAQPAARVSEAPAQPAAVTTPGQVSLARAAMVSPTSFRVGNGELSPAVVEILASLEAPRPGRVRET